jgi:hypothetical protein
MYLILKGWSLHLATLFLVLRRRPIDTPGPAQLLHHQRKEQSRGNIGRFSKAALMAVSMDVTLQEDKPSNW